MRNSYRRYEAELGRLSSLLYPAYDGRQSSSPKPKMFRSTRSSGKSISSGRETLHAQGNHSWSLSTVKHTVICLSESTVRAELRTKKNLNLCFAHSVHSPDLAPCDFYVFGSVKADEEVSGSLRRCYATSQKKSFSPVLVKRWQTCIEHGWALCGNPVCWYY